MNFCARLQQSVFSMETLSWDSPLMCHENHIWELKIIFLNCLDVSSKIQMCFLKSTENWQKKNQKHFRSVNNMKATVALKSVYQPVHETLVQLWLCVTPLWHLVRNGKVQIWLLFMSISLCDSRFLKFHDPRKDERNCLDTKPSVWFGASLVSKFKTTYRQTRQMETLSPLMLRAM